MSSSARLSVVCRLSATFVHPTQATEIFGNVSTIMWLLPWRTVLRHLCRLNYGKPGKSSLINHLINYHHLNAWPTVIQMSPQLINISHIILIDPLLQHCQDSVIYVVKSRMLGSHRLGDISEVRHLATKLNDGCVCTVRWSAVLLKLPRLWIHEENGTQIW